MSTWGRGLRWAHGGRWAGAVELGSRAIVGEDRLDAPLSAQRAIIGFHGVVFPSPSRALVAAHQIITPAPTVAIVGFNRVAVPSPPTRGIIGFHSVDVPTGAQRAIIAFHSFVVGTFASRAVVGYHAVVTPEFGRRAIIGHHRLLFASPPPGTGGPQPDNPDTPGGIDPDTGRPILIEFNRVLGVKAASAPFGPSGKVSWSHLGGFQGRMTNAAGVQWYEDYHPRYMDDPEFWDFQAYARELKENRRPFLIKPPSPLRQEVLGSISGTPVVAGAGQTGQAILTAGWTGNLLAGNLLQIEGITYTFDLVKAVTSADPTMMIHPKIRVGGSPADGAQVFIGPQVRLRALIADMEMPTAEASDRAMVGLRLYFREAP